MLKSVCFYITVAQSSIMVMLCYDWVCYGYKYESTEDQKTEFSYRSPIVNLACPLGIASANW